jgi:uncharacterized membrane protein
MSISERYRLTAITAASAAIATLIPVALYQCHAIEQLPDPPGAWFDSEKITSSKAAHPMGVPDSLPGLASYGVTLALAIMSRRSPQARKLFGAKLVLDGSMAAVNVVKQVVSFGRLCSWCTGTALMTAVLVPAGLKYVESRESEISQDHVTVQAGPVRA